jgi:acetone carboxylase gamma subunit
MLFTYSSVSVPQKKKKRIYVYIYPECAKTWGVSAVQPAYPFTESVYAITIIYVTGSVNKHKLSRAT